jgi:threonine/homoserine/homoserine lactone efflux protein
LYWIAPALYGLLAGFMMSILLGVVFFLLIQAGIQHGTKKGMIIAAGVVTGDLIFLSLSIGFTAAISGFLQQHSHTIALVGGCILLLMGGWMWVKKQFADQGLKAAKGLQTARDFFVKPFIINVLNPANAAWWLGLYSFPPASGYELQQKIVFGASAIIAIFSTEVGIAAGASLLKNYIHEKWLKKVDQLVAIIMFLMGLNLLFRGFF